MSPADIADSVAYMLLAWGTGFCTGYMWKVIRKLFETAGAGE